MRRFALTAIGRDRPGIVASVSRALYEHDCNIEDSSMAALEDEFAIILIMSMQEKGDADALRRDLAALTDAGLTVTLKEIGERGADSPSGNYLVTLHGADKAGIVYRLAALLSSFGVNITDLETKVIDSPVKVYMMLMEIYAREDIDVKALADGLKTLERELGVTIRLKPVEETEVL
jgi:glycine cleavage system transcriptional repressor